MKFLLIVAAIVVGITSGAMADNAPPAPRVTTGYVAYKKPFNLDACVKHAQETLDNFKSVEVTKGYYTTWGSTDHVTVSITCAYESATVFFAYAGPNDMTNESFENIMRDVQNKFEPDKSKLKLNPKGRAGME